MEDLALLVVAYLVVALRNQEDSLEPHLQLVVPLGLQLGLVQPQPDPLVLHWAEVLEQVPRHLVILGQLRLV